MKQILKINTMFAEFNAKNNLLKTNNAMAIFMAICSVVSAKIYRAIKPQCGYCISLCVVVLGGTWGDSPSCFNTFHYMPRTMKDYSAGNNSTYSVTPKVSDITTSSIQHLISHLANLPKSSHITINVHTIIGDNNVQKVNKL